MARRKGRGSKPVEMLTGEWRRKEEANRADKSTRWFRIYYNGRVAESQDMNII